MPIPAPEPVSVTRAMTRRVTRRLSMLLAIGSLILTGMIATAAPARAQNSEDIVRFLLGAAAVAVIIRAIDDNHRPTYIAPRVLPDSCLETARVDRRMVEIYNARCLSRAGYHSLPQRCEVNLRTDRGRRTGYEAQCLYRAGYSPERHGARPLPHRPGHGVLPRHCEMTYRERGNRIAGYDGQCLSGAGLRNLPRHCAVTARNGQRLFNAQCLLDAGYRRGRR